MTGRIDECVTSAQRLADSAREFPGLAYANLAFLMGHANLVRGDLPGAVKLLHEALAGVEKHSVTTGRPASCFALAEAHAKLGEPAAAAAAPGGPAVRACRLPVHADRFVAGDRLDAGRRRLAVRGRRGKEAPRRMRGTAVQPTHELACLQAAIQWGDIGAARIRELADALSLPLANTISRHAESLLSGDGDGLLAASAEYREIGDRAPPRCRRPGGRGVQRRAAGRGRYAAALAQQLADECGGCAPRHCAARSGRFR